MITYYFYDKGVGHTSIDTEKRIMESVRRYFCDIGCKTPDVIEVRRHLSGKPYLYGDKDLPHIGVSHTDKTVVIAVGNEPFGIDMEEDSRRMVRRDALSLRYYSESEQAYVNRGGEAEKDRRFLEIWVKKEAYVKYFGTGLKDIAKADIFSVGGSFERLPCPGHILYLYKP